MDIVRTLGVLLRTGAYSWDVRSYDGNQPPGAWLKRLRPTGLPLDLAAPFFLHPLEVLAVHEGRYGETSERMDAERFSDGRARGFLHAMRTWGSGLQLRPGPAARWFYVFTPVKAEFGGYARTRLEKRAKSVWEYLEIPGSHADAVASVASATVPPGYRKYFWTTEVDL